MASSPDDFPPTLPPTGSPLARDRGLRRSRRLTRWIAVTAVAGAAALGSLYTHLLPGGSSPAPAVTPSLQHPATPSPAPATGGSDGNDHHEDDEDEGAAPAAQPTPHPPARPPAPTQQQPHTTTGAS